MYKAILSGSTKSKSGVLVTFDAGKTLPFKKGELDHCRSVVWVDENPKKKDNENEYPKQGNAGWYELSNGKKIRGEEEAKEAQAKLDENESN